MPWGEFVWPTGRSRRRDSTAPRRVSRCREPEIWDECGRGATERVRRGWRPGTSPDRQATAPTVTTGPNRPFSDRPLFHRSLSTTQLLTFTKSGFFASNACKKESRQPHRIEKMISCNNVFFKDKNILIKGSISGIKILMMRIAASIGAIQSQKRFYHRRYVDDAGSAPFDWLAPNRPGHPRTVPDP